MPSSAGGSAEEVFYKQMHYRPVRPLEHQLECLDVLIRVDQHLLHRIALKMSRTKLTPLVKQGSMLTEDLMAEDSKWRSPEGAAQLLRIRRGRVDLKNALKQKLSSAEFQKELLPKASLEWKKSTGVVAWLCGITGVDLGGEESLYCTLDGLTAASVDFTKVRGWLSAGDWRPDATTLKLCSGDWSKDGNRIKKLWIVTEVLYGKKCTVGGSNGYSHKVMAKYSITGVPGAGVDVGAEIGIHKIDESSVELRAKRNKQFIVGYRTMRIDYNPDGTLHALKAPGDTGVRAGDDDDPHQTNLISMEEDIFEVDEDGVDVPIPLLTPTEQEVQALRSVVAADSREEGSLSI